MPVPIFKAPGVPLFKAAGIPAMDPNCCCCVCTVLTPGYTCACVDTDYGPKRAGRSVQVDLALSPSVWPTYTMSEVTKAGACGSGATVTCPDINGSYVLSADDADTSNFCRVRYTKRVHTTVCSGTPTAGYCIFSGTPSGSWTLCNITQLQIEAYLHGVNDVAFLPDYLMVIVSIMNNLIWVKTSEVGLIDLEEYAQPPDYNWPTNVYGNFSQYFNISCSQQESLRTIKYSYAVPASLHTWQYVLGGQCTTECNVAQDIQACYWGSGNSPSDDPATETYGSGNVSYGCDYNSGTPTVSQI